MVFSEISFDRKRCVNCNRPRINLDTSAIHQKKHFWWTLVDFRWILGVFDCILVILVILGKISAAGEYLMVFRWFSVVFGVILERKKFQFFASGHISGKKKKKKLSSN